MKVWIAFHGYDYEGEDVIGVYSNFEAARSKCIQEIAGDSRYTISEGENSEGEKKFYAKGRSQAYSVAPFEVE